MSRLCFDSSDVENFAATMTQAEILKEIRLADYLLATLPESEAGSRFYWNDRKEALELAYDLSLMYNLEPQGVESLRQQVFSLQEKLATYCSPQKNNYQDISI